jgi:hypothetical protein
MNTNKKVLLYSFIAGVVVSLSIYTYNTSVQTAFLKEALLQEKQPTIIEIMQYDLDKNRLDRESIQGEIDSLIDRKEYLSVEADNIKTDMKEELGL